MLVNGYLTDTFPVERSVCKGVASPLYCMFYVLSLLLLELGVISTLKVLLFLGGPASPEFLCMLIVPLQF